MEVGQESRSILANQAARSRAAKFIAVDLLFTLLALAGSFAASPWGRELLWAADFWVQRAPVVLILTAAALVWRRTYAILPRFIGIHDFASIALVAAPIGLITLFNEFRIQQSIFAGWDVAIMTGLLAVSLMTGSRLVVRLQAIKQLSRTRRQPTASGRTLIVGAGDAGETVFRELVKNGPKGSVVIGYVDDNPRTAGVSIHGVHVLGTVDDIPAICEKQGVNEILIAIPSAKPSELRRIFKICAQTKARIRTVPSISELIDGSGKSVSSMRDFEVQDLLRRDSISTDMAGAKGYINAERVLVTGAGGSIGSELARQIAKFNPASLTLLGKGEGSIFEIEQELKFKGILPSSIICDVRDRASLARAFSEQFPAVVFHAAAHKHVPLMESVPIEAIRNNIFGTLNVAQEAMKAGSKSFILVSTDKAVNPENVMGATKRVAEMIVASLSALSETSFSIVRFGNVLGSRGSLVPTLKRQIAWGGPVTVTHPDMTRYFMTIPEAAELIVQAGSLGANGEIFVLDMGDPIKITDLVQDIIRMHGLVPGQDIEIKFIGKRPGEKMHEELYFKAEDVRSSGHEKIHLIANKMYIPWDWMKAQLEELDRICLEGDQQKARAFLMELAWAKNLPPVGSRSIS